MYILLYSFCRLGWSIGLVDWRRTNRLYIANVIVSQEAFHISSLAPLHRTPNPSTTLCAPTLRMALLCITVWCVLVYRKTMVHCGDLLTSSLLELPGVVLHRCTCCGRVRCRIPSYNNRVRHVSSPANPQRSSTRQQETNLRWTFRFRR